MVIDKKLDAEIISKEEKKWRDHLKGFEDMNKSFKTQIELNDVLIKHCLEKIEKSKTI